LHGCGPTALERRARHGQSFGSARNLRTDRGLSFVIFRFAGHRAWSGRQQPMRRSRKPGGGAARRFGRPMMEFPCGSWASYRGSDASSSAGHERAAGGPGAADLSRSFRRFMTSAVPVVSVARRCPPARTLAFLWAGDHRLSRRSTMVTAAISGLGLTCGVPTCRHDRADGS